MSGQKEALLRFARKGFGMLISGAATEIYQGFICFINQRTDDNSPK